MARFRRLSDLNPPILTADERWQYLLPGAPTGVTATAGNAQAAVSWTAPASVATITDYVVQYSSNGGSAWTTFSDGTSTATSATVTGLTNGTAYTFRVAAVSGIGQGPWSAASGSVTPSLSDPFFSQVALLLHMDGTGSTFVDSSGAPKTITAVGNATQSTVQSKWGGKSAYFSTSSDAIYASGVNIGTGDFAVEMFFKTNSDVQYAQLIGNENFNGSEGFSLLINNDSRTGGQIALYRGGLVLSTPSGDYSDDAWHYLALSRSSGTVRLYLDGTLAATGTSSASFSSSAGLYMAYNNAFPPRNMLGYLDEVRITVGSDRSFTGSTVPVPTAAFPDA